jgi:hypothetical protein
MMILLGIALTLAEERSGSKVNTFKKQTSDLGCQINYRSCGWPDPDFPAILA